MDAEWTFTTAPHSKGGTLCILQTKTAYLWTRCIPGREHAMLTKMLQESGLQ